MSLTSKNNKGSLKNRKLLRTEVDIDNDCF